MGSREGPLKWLCGWCSRGFSCLKCDCGSACSKCNCCRCKCDCVPLLCPPPEEQLKVDEVSADDYMVANRFVKTKIRKDTPLKALLRSFGGLCVGILLTMAYAFIVLFIKNYNLWFCLITTLAIASFLSLGMAFSRKVRITILLMLLEIFSSEVKTIILFLAFAMIVQGPTANIIENGKRSTESMACGAQLVLNETKEMSSMVTNPILRGTLRRMWSFIARIGDVCNEELERPYHRCNKLFDEAKNNCFKVMSFMGFLCYILDAFKPLCGLAKIVVLICVIPDYVQAFVRKRIKNPIVDAAMNFKAEFDFNITILDDETERNITINIFEVASDIMKDFREDAQFYMEIFHMFSYSMFFLCVYTYVQALRYRRSYLTDLNHDNIYITREFIELDVMRAKQGRQTLLPLSSGEGYDFIRPASLSLTKKEKKGYVFAILNVVRSLLLALLIIFVDYYFFCLLDYVDHLMKEKIVIREPNVLSLLVNGTGEAEEIYVTLVSAFDALKKSNIIDYTKKCQVIPSKPDFLEYGIIGFIHGLALVIAVIGIYVQRLRRYICASYYPTREQERICFLYNQFLTKRTHLEKVLYQSIRFNKADKGHNNILLILAAKCPFLFGWLAKFLVAKEDYCIGCAQAITSKNSKDYYECSTFGCKGKYCGGCSRILNNTCTLCKAPLVYSESDSEEIDSSDDEQIALWLEGLKSIEKGEKTKRKKMKKVIKGHLKEGIKRGRRNEELIQKYKESRMSSDSEDTSALSDVDTGDDSEDYDFKYQSSKVTDEFYQGWRSTLSKLEDDVLFLTDDDIQDTTGGGTRNREVRDVERNLIHK
ncbi:DC-STAMP domain-containing protein 2 isoform X2 [Hyla sarda]|uniref:DC-STAMP domain-containing protein 2 isoform X2 n=1 Tax=Hyla sarda TaxID=327740 RepID=UPI0024C21EDB|nr:DC-STAMP domain-containing protein 2 isoform X2 [Hyla sarda]